MKNKIQAIIIIFLMIASILLFLTITGGISEGLNILGFGRDSKSLDTRQSLATLVSPHIMFINYGEEDHALATRSSYESLFNEIPSILEEIFDESKNNILSEDLIGDNTYNALLLQKSIVINFNQNIPTNTLLNILGIENQNSILDKYIDIDSIYISLIKNFIILRTNKLNILITYDNLDTKNIESEILNIKSRGYKPYLTVDEYFKNGKVGFLPNLEKTKLEKIKYYNKVDYLESESLQNIISRFFKSDYNKIRQIEGDGETVYLDGEKSIKINDYGFIEYADNKNSRESDRNLYLTLERFVEFVSLNLGFDDSYFLENITPVEDESYKGYIINIGKKEQDLTVIPQSDEKKSYIEATVYNDNVKKFNEVYRGTFSQSFEYFTLAEDSDIKSTILTNMATIRKRLEDPYIPLNEIYDDLVWANIFFKDLPEEEYLRPYWKMQIRDEVFEFPIKTVEE